MRRAGLTLVSIMALVGFGVPVAEAGVTCRIIPSWCPADSNKTSTHESNTGGGTVKQTTSVPEPGSLMLLAAGASAVGGAVLRRRRQKKD